MARTGGIRLRYAIRMISNLDNPPDGLLATRGYNQQLALESRALFKVSFVICGVLTTFGLLAITP